MLHPVAAGSPALHTLDGYAEAPPKARSYWQTVRYRLRHDYLTLGFGSVVLLIVLSAICAPLLAPADPYQTSMIARLKPFGYKGHLLGTDELGRDMLSRLLYGGRVSLTMGMVPVMLATVIGGTLGLVAGYTGKHLNMAIMRIMDVFFAFPSILLAVAISGTMGGGMRNGMLALTLVFIPPLCRVAETATTQVSHLDFVEAARASGAGLCQHHLAPYSGQRAGSGPGLCQQPGQCQYPDRLGPELSRPGRGATYTRLGLDAEYLAPGDLYCPVAGCVARRADLHHVDMLQLIERWPAGCDGRTDVTPAQGDA